MKMTETYNITKFANISECVAQLGQPSKERP